VSWGVHFYLLLLALAKTFGKGGPPIIPCGRNSTPVTFESNLDNVF